jgi:large subunit ribosomal protein L24
MRLKKGDRVVVLTGKNKGTEGDVLEVFPKRNKVIVEHVNVAKKHQKARSATMQTGIVEKIMPIDASNVAVLSKGKPSRIVYRVESGRKVRYAIATGEELS